MRDVTPLIVRCRCRTGLPADDFRAWLERHHGEAATPTRFTVVEPAAPEGALWIVEVDVDGDPAAAGRDAGVAELLTDLRLLGLDPAVYVPAR